MPNLKWTCLYLDQSRAEIRLLQPLTAAAEAVDCAVADRRRDGRVIKYWPNAGPILVHTGPTLAKCRFDSGQVRFAAGAEGAARGCVVRPKAVALILI